MSSDPQRPHLATISHDGRFWDVYLEVEVTTDGQARGRLAFSAAGDPEAQPIRTADIFIESTPDAILSRAREFKSHQLLGLLRSALPD